METIYLYREATPKSPFVRGQRKGSVHRRKLIALFRKQKGRCHYCRVKTIITPSGKEWKGNEPKNLATVEHLYPAWDIRRALCSFYEHTVLSCWKCNQEKNEADYSHLREHEVFIPVIDIKPN